MQSSLYIFTTQSSFPYGFLRADVISYRYSTSVMIIILHSSTLLWDMLISTKMYFKLKYPVYRINSIIFKTSSGEVIYKMQKLSWVSSQTSALLKFHLFFYFYIEIVYKNILDIKLHDIYSPFLCSFFSFHKKQQIFRFPSI